VKRLLAAGLFVLGFATAGVLSGPVIADITTSVGTTTTTVTSTTAPTTTTTAPTTTTTPAPRPPKPKPPHVATLPAGVRIAGVRVGGLTHAQAVAAVQASFARPLPVVIDQSRLAVDPVAFASAYVSTAVARARVSRPGTNVTLVVAVRGKPLRAWVAAVHKRFARPPSDATLAFRNSGPVIQPEKVGRTLSARLLTRRLVSALAGNSRQPIRVHTRAIAPAVTATAFDEVIVINRETNHLFLYTHGKLDRVFPVATGQAIYPTPLGTFHIVVKWKNPWWYPPTQDAWAKGLKPVPPGPSNPLGTRWMGLNAPGVGIHGTDAPASIGYSASHGCIRMQVPDAEWLFEQVHVGTPVVIL
jgi:lipoprotein-anchoring transpeptidase ErfK/SrfK